MTNFLSIFTTPLYFNYNYHDKPLFLNRLKQISGNQVFCVIISKINIIRHLKGTM